MFIPSHCGSVQSAYADALAKCHLDARCDDLLTLMYSPILIMFFLWNFA